MEVAERVTIWSLKRRMRGLYLEYLGFFERYDCGAQMIAYLNPRFCQCINEFNQTVDQLSPLDPACPKTKLELPK